MKKIWKLLLCSVLLFSMTACGSSASKDISDSNISEASIESTSELNNEIVESTEDNNDARESTEKDPEEKTAVVCFSGTGNTMAVAETIAHVIGADLFEMIPAEKYTDEDLNYSDDNCRANKEQNDPDARPEIENDLSAVEEYRTIYLGYPIWWGTNPRIIQTFLDTNNLSDATIYTFCTSGGSGIERSISDLQASYPDLQIVTGKRLNNASENDIKEWIEGITEQKTENSDKNEMRSISH